MTRGFLPPPPSGRGSPGALCGRQAEKAGGVQQAFPFHPCYFLFLSPKRKKKKKKKKEEEKKKKGKSWIGGWVGGGGRDRLGSPFEQQRGGRRCGEEEMCP